MVFKLYEVAFWSGRPGAVEFRVRPLFVNSFSLGTSPGSDAGGRAITIMALFL